MKRPPRYIDIMINTEIRFDTHRLLKFIRESNEYDLNANQSLVLGDDFMTQFEVLLNNLINLATVLQGAQIWPGGSALPDPSIPPIASTVQSSVQKILQVVKKGQLLSKVSKTI